MIKVALYSRVSSKKIDKSHSILRPMKILCVLFTASILISSSWIFAEMKDVFVATNENDDFSAIYIHQGMFNGTHWIQLSPLEKRAYLLGYEDGFISNAIFYIEKMERRNEALESLPTSIAEITTEGLINEIDKLYKDFRNIKIPIPYALIIIRNKLLGVEQSKIDSYIEHLRSQLKKIAEEKE